MIFPLTEVQVQNFRGLRDVTVALHPQVTVLFGANAAGKTTLLDALAIALGAFIRRVPGSQGRDFAKVGDLRVPWRVRQGSEERPGVECPYARVRLSGGDGVAWDVTRLRSRQDRAQLPDGAGVRTLHSWIDPRIKEALEAPEGQITRPIPFVAGYGNERAVVEVPLRERGFQREFRRLAALDRTLTATTRFKAVFEWFRLMEDAELREQRQRKDFGYRLPALEWVRQAVGRAELHCVNPRIETRPIRMLVDFLHPDGTREPLDIRALSDGYRTHLALVVDLARRMVQLNPSDDVRDLERGTNSPSVVLIDEIDLHLDPPWQGRVLQGLLGAFPRTQFVVTTHSEQVIASVEAASVRHLRWGDGEIVVDDVRFAQGASSERILVELMGAPERVGGPTQDRLRRYLELVSAGQGTGATARELRAQLERDLPGDPDLNRADLEMQRQALMARLDAARSEKT